MIALSELNDLPTREFVTTLGAIFEHSPWVAERAAAGRPYASRLHLLEAMRMVVEQASPEEQSTLIRAHPKLGARGRTRAELTQASASEQHRAGLDACTPQDFAQLDGLNTAYVEKFAMPFILAVRGHDPESIIATLKRRLTHDEPFERNTALGQIGLIAGFRLTDVVATPAGVEIMAMNERLALCSDRTGVDRTGVDGTGVGQGSAALLREWMLAAGLDVSAAGGGNMMGRRRTDRSNAKRLLVGVHYDTAANTVRYDGRLGCLLGIAVTQQLKQKGRHLPFELLVLARPSDERAGRCASLADPDALRGCVTLSALDGATLDGAVLDGAGGSEDGSWVLAALRASGLAEGILAIAVQGPAGVVYRSEAPCGAAECERAAHTLEEFLLQTQDSSFTTG
ncbi:MAG: beta-ureidopropionase / N-carbamoyl-L-amino-acid hydrolase [Gammaproteobacteria bacterium]|nr:beta-ureidopropionase / N-carbamoyl-L-amino-acid hydrolase [Gammaproteobacteria bacterium]